MKNFKTNVVFIVCFSIISHFGFSQDDYQWYVKEKKLLDKNTSNYTPIPQGLSNNSVYLRDVKHPGPPITNNGQTKTPMNDIFIIYEDGSYFNSRLESNWASMDGQYLSFSDSDYLINTTKSIDYLYLTNVYENDDDPNGRSYNPTPPAPLPNYKSIQLSSQNNRNNTNVVELEMIHDIVRNTDFVLIVKAPRTTDGKEVQPSGPFNVCWEIANNANNVNFGVSNVFANGTKFAHNFQSPSNIISGSCINGLTLNTDDVGYINLRVPDVISPDLIGKDLDFKVNGVTKLSVKISDAHDPNLIKHRVLGVENNVYYGEFEFVCTNDSPLAGTNTTYLTLTKPTNFSEIFIESASLNNTTISPDNVTIIDNPSNIVFKFGGLNILGSNYLNSTVKMNFTVKYAGSPNFQQNKSIFPGSFTTFETDLGSTDYYIQELFSLCDDYSILQEGMKVWTVGNRSYCPIDSSMMDLNYEFDPCRYNLEKCKWYYLVCCGCIQWIKIGLLLALIGILIYLNRYKRSSRSKK